MLLLNESDAKRDYTGAMVAPGEYTVTLSKEVDGITTDLSEPMKFKVERMYKGALDGAAPEVTAAFLERD